MKLIEYNNIKFYIGKNAKENWELLDKAKNENEKYIWFHLEKFTSPYVIMWCSLDDLEEIVENNNKIEESQIHTSNFLNFGSQLCKENSKYKFLKDVKVMYTTVKKISKTEKIGEVNVKGKYLTI